MADKKKKTQRRVDDIMLYLCVITVLINSDPLFFNQVDVSQNLRLSAIDVELTNLMSAFKITPEKVAKYAEDLDWSETSPEQRELNNVLTQAALKVINSGKEDNE